MTMLVINWFLLFMFFGPFVIGGIVIAAARSEAAKAPKGSAMQVLWTILQFAAAAFIGLGLLHFFGDWWYCVDHPGDLTPACEFLRPLLGR